MANQSKEQIKQKACLATTLDIASIASLPQPIYVLRMMMGKKERKTVTVATLIGYICFWAAGATTQTKRDRTSARVASGNRCYNCTQTRGFKKNTQTKS